MSPDRFGPVRHPAWCARAPMCGAITGGAHLSRLVVLGRGRGSHEWHLRLWAVDEVVPPALRVEIVHRGYVPWWADLDLTGARALARAILDLIATAGPRRGNR